MSPAPEAEGRKKACAKGAESHDETEPGYTFRGPVVKIVVDSHGQGRLTGRGDEERCPQFARAQGEQDTGGCQEPRGDHGKMNLDPGPESTGLKDAGRVQEPGIDSAKLGEEKDCRQGCESCETGQDRHDAAAVDLEGQGPVPEGNEPDADQRGRQGQRGRNEKPPLLCRGLALCQFPCGGQSVGQGDTRGQEGDPEGKKDLAPGGF